jgi:hypothetical protein
VSSHIFFASRNALGAISMVSAEPFEGCEAVHGDAPELTAFFGHPPSDSAFSTSDAEFVRVLEDLIDTLISKNVLRHTDLPLAAQRKITARKGMRNSLQGALKIFRQDDPLL